jgi:hypothetical protein
MDCDGVPNGDNEFDACGVCGGDGTSCTNTPADFEFNISMQFAFYFFGTVTIDDVIVDSLDWVGVFNGDICVGSRQWNPSNCGGGTCDVPTMGYDGSEPTNGYMNYGNIPTFKIYDFSEATAS